MYHYLLSPSIWFIHRITSVAVYCYWKTCHIEESVLPWTCNIFSDLFPHFQNVLHAISKSLHSTPIDGKLPWESWWAILQWILFQGKTTPQLPHWCETTIGQSQSHFPMKCISGENHSTAPHWCETTIGQSQSHFPMKIISGENHSTAPPLVWHNHRAVAEPFPYENNSSLKICLSPGYHSRNTSSSPVMWNPKFVGWRTSSKVGKLHCQCNFSSTTHCQHFIFYVLSFLVGWLADQF